MAKAKPWKPMKRKWHGNRAVLFVHGVGNAKRGDYAALVRKIRKSLGQRASDVALYELYYDVLSDWAAAKIDLAGILGKILPFLKSKTTAEIGDEGLAAQVAESAGDILLPAFSRSARLAVRDAYVAQLLQMVVDGREAARPVQPENQKLSIICHSLGCFHTFEVLHAIAKHPHYQLHPTLNLTTFENVIFMASPVQLIRTSFGAIDAAIPGRSELAVLKGVGLEQPGDPEEFAGSIRNWVSITGDLDPIGGYFLRKKAPWAYMDVQPQVSIVDEQHIVKTDDNGGTRKALVRLLKSALSSGASPPRFKRENPHSWTNYIDRHRKEISEWVLA